MTAVILAVFLLAVIFAVCYVFLIMPRVSDRADMELLATDYAHRGLHGGAYPENSLPAFYAAVRQGYGIELDVRLTRDGEVAVFHDATAKRMCGYGKKIEGLTLAQLKALRLGGTEFTVPTLAEVLELVDGASPLLIEIKGEGGSADRLCRCVAELLDTYPGAFAIQSFDPKILGWFKRYRPRFARGQLVCPLKSVRGRKHPRLTAFALSNMLTNVISRPDFISVNGRQLKNPSFRICVALFKCRAFVWTVRTPRQYRHVHRLGLFAIFENFNPN